MKEVQCLRRGSRRDLTHRIAELVVCAVKCEDQRASALVRRWCGWCLHVAGAGRQWILSTATEMVTLANGRSGWGIRAEPLMLYCRIVGLGHQFPEVRDRVGASLNHL